MSLYNIYKQYLRYIPITQQTMKRQVLCKLIIKYEGVEPSFIHETRILQIHVKTKKRKIRDIEKKFTSETYSLTTPSKDTSLRLKRMLSSKSN